MLAFLIMVTKTAHSGIDFECMVYLRPCFICMHKSGVWGHRKNYCNHGEYLYAPIQTGNCKVG